MRPPDRIATPRLVLRPWRTGEGALLKAAIDASLPELRRWMPWAHQEPSTVEATEEHIARFRAAFDEGSDFVLGILTADETEVVGGTGLHPRVGPDAFEIGYWIRSDLTGRGLATETAGALTRVAFEHVGVSRVEIRCDPANVASAAVARRLGYRLRELLPADKTTPEGEPRGTMVWEMTREEHARGCTAGAAGPLPSS